MIVQNEGRGLEPTLYSTFVTQRSPKNKKDKGRRGCLFEAGGGGRGGLMSYFRVCVVAFHGLKTVKGF